MQNKNYCMHAQQRCSIHNSHVSLNQFNVICRKESIGSIQLSHTPPPPGVYLLNVGDDLFNVK